MSPKEFFNKVCRMRKAQKEYFRTKSGRALNESKADVDTVKSSYDSNFAYVSGAMVEVADFDDNRWNECAPGIHFFIDRRAAVEY